MFDIGWNELLVIAMVAIVVIGPKDLPRVMRTVGRWVRKLKRMGSEFQSQFNEALREAELEDVRKGVEDLRNINPLNSVRDELTKAGEDIKKGMDVNAPAAAATAAAVSSPEPAPLVDTSLPAEEPATEPVEAAPPPAPSAPAPAAAAGEVKP